ncbi:uncharacterized protein LOC108677472 [Hyalella azteca]|uniref:Uncharacterized protein LOC108677472 n=1 Tax=Hyalella azteca TaxID=294128 RepID=A0A8B7P5H2_HYAAZ|nr:uncharacterized protein LOC108677472 [Hyalella azteca]
MISVKMLLPTLLVVVAAGAALGSPQQATYVTYRREGKEEPASSYASHQPTYGSPAPAQPSHGSQPTSYGAPSTNYGPPTQSYKAQPAVMYALMPSEMPKKEEEKKEEDDKKKKPQTKEEKKCAIKKVLPPLILITIFIGMILLQLWAPRLVASLVNPIVNPIADGIDAIAASIAAGRQSSWNQRAATDDVNIEPALNAIDSFLQLTVRVTAVLSNETCFAAMLCEAAATVPQPDLSSRMLKYVVPTRYHSYVKILTGGKQNCVKKYPCPAWSEHSNSI